MEVVSYLLTKEKDYVQGPLPGATRYLRDLLDAYWQGLSRLLPFFPRAALASAEDVREGHSRGAAIGKALKQWAGDDQVPGEHADRYYGLAFRDELSAERIPRVDEFEEIACRLLEPLIEHEESF